MTTHTGAMALPERVLSGVLDSLGVVTAETPGEAYEVAEMMARAPVTEGGRAAIVTHSGGIAIHLADLAERHGVDTPQPGPGLRSRLEPLLDLGVANNPLDMGGIIGGPGRFADVVETFAHSGEYDMVLAVSSAHPPAHTEERVAALLASRSPIPVLHLWMAGDQGSEGLRRLREAGAAVTEEPRAAIRALAGMTRRGQRHDGPVEPLKAPFEEWGLPLVEGQLAADAASAAAVAGRLGFPVAVKVSSPGLAHKTEIGGVVLGVKDEASVADAFRQVTSAARSAGLAVDGARVERYRPGLEMNIAALVDPVFGTLVSVGMGGVFTELLQDVVFAPAPIDQAGARAMIDRLRSRAVLDGVRGGSPTDIDELSRILSLVSRGLIGAGLSEVEVNPLVWDGAEWVAVDWLVVQAAG
jgi:acyl-CoA synthetase (NDP forming)